MIYFAKRLAQHDLVQYDADPRELGTFAAQQNVGKVAHFTVGDIDSRDLQFKIPPIDDVVTSVLKACNAVPYSGTHQLSARYADALVSATDAVNSYTSSADHKPDALSALEGIVITTPEWSAYQEISDLYYVSLAENGKAKGQATSPRRKRCADALVAEFKASRYKVAPDSCAYVAKESPEYKSYLLAVEASRARVPGLLRTANQC